MSPSRRARLLRRVLAVIVATTAVTAFASPADAGERPDLPPPTRDALAKIFDPQLEDLGLHTTRATLQNLDTYRSDPDGTHLAIYVEPDSDAMSNEEYLENVTRVTKVFLPKVFKRWTDLESFDVCQEPPQALDDRTAPPPVTQVLVSRKGLKRVHWRSATLEDIVAASTIKIGAPTSASRDFYLFVNDEVAALPAYQAALAAARPTTTSAPRG